MADGVGNARQRWYRWGLLVILVAAIAYGAIATHQGYRLHTESRERQLVDLAGDIADRTNGYFAQLESVYSALKETPCLQQRSEALCAPLFAGLNQRFPQVINFAAIDRSGRFFASGKPFGAKGAPDGRKLSFFKDLESGRPRALMDPHLGPVSQKMVTGFAVPLNDAENRFDGLIGVSLDFAHLETLWRDLTQEAVADVLILDEKGRVIFDSRQRPTWLRLTNEAFGINTAQLGKPGSTRFNMDDQDYVGRLAPIGDQWTVLALHAAPPSQLRFIFTDPGAASTWLTLLLLIWLSLYLLWRDRKTLDALLQSEHALTRQAADLELMVADRTQALQTATDDLARLLNAQADAIFGIDQRGLCTFINRAGCEMLAFPDESAVVGHDVHHLVHHSYPDGRTYPTTACPIHTTAQTGRSCHIDTECFWRPDGTSFPVEYWAYPIEKDEQCVGAVVSFRDISDRIVARRREAELAAVFEVLPDLFFRFDADNRITGYRAHLGTELYVPPETFIGRLMSDVLPTPVGAQVTDALNQARRHQRIETVEYRLPMPGGEEDYELRAIPLPDSPEVVAIVRNITERRATELKLRETTQSLERINAELEQRVAERTTALEHANRELEAFTHAVSHDLKAPLRAIDGFTSILVEDYRDRLDAEARKLLDHVASGARRMNDLIEGLLELSRQTRGELNRTACDLSAIAGQVAESLRQGDPSRQVHIDIQPNLVAWCDPRMAHSLLENLLGNAWKFTSRTAAPHIAFSGELLAATADEVPQLRCSVSDNGAGFDMAYARQLFKPFQRLHRASDFPGTGIGLATVQRIVTQHGGAVSATSTPGQGTTISFTLATREP